MTTTAAEDQATGIPRVTVLHGYTTMDTAHLTEDYPYGRRLRCQRREWLEYKPKQGYRFVTQTTDPRRPGEVWNKPHASTYHMWAVLVQQEPVNGEAFGRIGTMSASYGVEPATHVRFALSGALAQLDDQQYKMYRVLLRLGRERSQTITWDRWRETIALMTAHRGEDGGLPSRDELLTGHRHYIAEHDYPVARAQILTGFDPFAELA